MRALVSVYIIEEVAQAHAQNEPLEWLSTQTHMSKCVTKEN